jgi:hypothetical protein
VSESTGLGPAEGRRAGRACRPAGAGTGRYRAPHFDLRHHRAISDQLAATTGRFRGLDLERAKEAVTKLSAEDRVQLARWLAESHPAEGRDREGAGDTDLWRQRGSGRPVTASDCSNGTGKSMPSFHGQISRDGRLVLPSVAGNYFPYTGRRGRAAWSDGFDLVPGQAIDAGDPYRPPLATAGPVRSSWT